jgi:hypothetical protein
MVNRSARLACKFFFENMGRRGLGHFKQNSSIASFQHGVLESKLKWMSPEHRANLDAGYPYWHDEYLPFHALQARVRS